MRESPCPDPAALRAFALGMTGEADWDAVASHLDACPGCAERLQGFDGSTEALIDRLSSLESAGAARAESDESDYARAVIERAAEDGDAHSRVAADAGRDLARRLLDGPVRLDRFELLSELGVGSFGYVFRAWDPRLERVVALKVQRCGSLATPDEVRQFQREAQSAARLEHPAIVSLHETGRTDDGVFFLVCEHVDGETLERLLEDGALPPDDAAGVAAEIADALQYAHEHGVIHRDVKPSNIIVDRGRRAHLMDFGLAKRDTGDGPTLTSEGRIMGTPAYMSPEQARGASRSVDARTDIYALGVVLYEMLTGERPFQGNRRLLLLQVLEDEPRPPRRLEARVPRDLEVICLKAMSKSPARRYATARELADDLRRFREGQPILARPMGTFERGVRWGRRYPLAVAVVVASILGSITGLLYLSSLSEYFVRQTALESARLEARMIDEVWRFYSEEIADIDAASTNVAITQHYRTVHPALPLPATFAIDLGERLSARSLAGMEVRVYSRHPWPGRSGGGTQDEFEASALDWLERNARPGAEPPAEYSRFESEAGRRKLFFATARHMEPSCIGCHNDPRGESPKTDWRVGDVAGVMKIVRPLDREIDNTRRGLRSAFVLMGAMSVLFFAASIAATVVLQRRRKAAAR